MRYRTLPPPKTVERYFDASLVSIKLHPTWFSKVRFIEWYRLWQLLWIRSFLLSQISQLIHGGSSHLSSGSLISFISLTAFPASRRARSSSGVYFFNTFRGSKTIVPKEWSCPFTGSLWAMPEIERNFLVIYEATTTFKHDRSIIRQSYWLTHLISLNLVSIKIIVHTPIRQHSILPGTDQLAIFVNWRACSRRVVFPLKFVLGNLKLPF